MEKIVCAREFYDRLTAIGKADAAIAAIECVHHDLRQVLDDPDLKQAITSLKRFRIRLDSPVYVEGESHSGKVIFE